jgi:hypothetical protein
MSQLVGKQILAGSITADRFDTLTTDVTFNGAEILGLPASPSATGAASKEYVDAVAGGLQPKASVNAVTAAVLPDYTRTVNVLNGNTLVDGTNAFVLNQTYKITVLGTDTNWATLGDKAGTPAVGDVFVAEATSGGHTIGTAGEAKVVLTGAQGAVVAAGAFVVGTVYTIKTLGTITNWQTAGAKTGAIAGDSFVAIAIGSGDGDAYTSLGVVDGIILTAGDRVLLKNGAAGADNGIYVVNTISPLQLTRAPDADNSPLGEVAAGMYCFAAAGTANGLKGWVLTTPDPIVLNTTALTFSLYSQVSDISIGVFGGSSDAKGLSISGGVITAHPVDGTNPGMMASADYTKLSHFTSVGTSVSIGANVTIAASANLAGTASGSNTGDITIGSPGAANANSLSLSNQVLSACPSSASHPGTMSASDFSKLAAISGSNTGDITITAAGAGSPNANAATLTLQALNLELANASFPGLMTAADFTKLAGLAGGSGKLNATKLHIPALLTSADGDIAFTGTIGTTNASGGEVAVFVNGQKQYVGSGTTTADCYFGPSAGTSRTFANIVSTDSLYWMGTTQAGFQLETTDFIDIMFTP